MKTLLAMLAFAVALGWVGNIAAVPPSGGVRDDQLFTDLLRDHVARGRVNYRELCEDERLAAYIAQLATTDPQPLNDDERLALWINAYNAYTLKIICDNYPVESINDLHSGGLVIGTLIKKTIWDRPFVVLGENTYSLNDVEHKIIRPQFDDPRTHFALVCAAVSCPPLRSEAYTGDKIDAQLDDQGTVFFAEPNKNHFDRRKKVAYLSKILDWYKGDFGDNDEEVLLTIAAFLPADVAKSIRANPGAWDIKYTDYDWSLNE